MAKFAPVLRQITIKEVMFDGTYVNATYYPFRTGIPIHIFDEEDSICADIGGFVIELLSVTNLNSALIELLNMTLMLKYSHPFYLILKTYCSEIHKFDLPYQAPVPFNLNDLVFLRNDGFKLNDTLQLSAVRKFQVIEIINDERVKGLVTRV